MLTGFLLIVALNVPPVAGPSVEAHRDAVAKFGAAVWNLRRDRLLTATRQFEAAAKADPDATAPLRELVRLYEQMGREPDAIRVAKQVLAKDPKDADTAHALARMLFDAGELKEAVAAAKLAAAAPLPIERADKTVAVSRDLATLCEKAGEPAVAETALLRAVELLTDRRTEVIASRALLPQEVDRAAAECLERLGKVRTTLKKYDTAADAFTAAAELYNQPRRANDPAAAVRLAWNLSGVQQASGDPLAALRHLETFLTLRPVATDPYLRLVQLLREAGRPGDVLPRLLTLTKTDPDNRPLQAVFAAELARDLDTRDDADRRFAKLNEKTNDPKIIAVIVRSHLDNRRPREIIADLDRAFAVLKNKDREDDDGKDEKKLDAIELAAARAFAAEKTRAVAGVIGDDRDAVVALLGAATEDARSGKKRTHGLHYFLGQLAARHNELALAASHFQDAVNNAPRDTIGDAYGALITVLTTARKPAEVARVCREALRTIDSLPLAPHYFNYYLAGALADLGDEKGAIAAADAAILTTAEGDRLTVRLRKASVLASLGKWDLAIELAKKLYDDFPAQADRHSIRYALSSAYWGAKKPAEAETELRAILDYEPSHAAAANDLGFHLADQGRNLAEAEQLIRHALTTDRHERRKAGLAEPENAAYLDSLGWVLFRQGKLAEARVQLERAATLYSGAADPVVWDHLGDVLFRLGEKNKAKAAWEKAAELYSAEPPGVRNRRDGRAEELKRKLTRIP